MVDDGPYVVLVHSHSERTGGYKYTVMRIHEPFLKLFTLRSGQAGMIVTYCDAACLHQQPYAESSCIVPCTAEHHGRATAYAGKLYYRLSPAECRPGAVDDVGSVGIASDNQRSGGEEDPCCTH